MLLHSSLSCSRFTLLCFSFFFLFFFFNDTAPTEIYTLSLHDALPIFPAQASAGGSRCELRAARHRRSSLVTVRSEEHTSELQSLTNLVCRLLLEKKKKNTDKDRLIVTNGSTEARHDHARDKERLILQI